MAAPNKKVTPAATCIQPSCPQTEPENLDAIALPATVTGYAPIIMTPPRKDHHAD
jgi:hypothetical protein